MNRQLLHDLSREITDLHLLVKIRLCILKTERKHVEFTFFRVINPLFLSPMGTVDSTTPLRPVSESHWRTCEVSTLYLESCANAHWIHILWVINPLFLTPLGCGRIVTTPSRPVLSRGVVGVPVKLQFCILKTVRMHVEFTFFEWLTVYFWAPWVP